MLVLVAHDGRTFELRAGPDTGVAAVREALAGLAGVPGGQQLLLCGGARLEGGRLGQHGLPAEGRDVFLFNRELLRADAPPPGLETLPFLSGADAGSGGEDGSEGSREGAHPLDDSPSPLLRALPVYRREFAQHRRRARQSLRRAQEGFAECQRLLAEMEVQALAIDAARENVDVHYAHIARTQEGFLAGFDAAGARHGALLDGFEGELEQMARIPLLRSAPPAEPSRAEAPRAGGAGRLKQHGFGTLADLLPAAKLRAWAAHCRTARGQFCGRVRELAGQVPGLQKEVEALFMTLPSVDLKELGLQIDAGEQQVAELASIGESLEKDTATVERLVDEAQADAPPPGGGASGSLSQSRLQPLDAIAALEPMNELHTGSHLPRSQELVAGVERLAAHCLKCKNAMNRSVHSQIKRIAALQSSIRDLRNRILVLQEVGKSQEKAFRELELARRVPLAFQACLAEVLRRQAFEKTFAAQAYGLAESMAATSEAEMAKRQAFLHHSEPLLPKELLEALGLVGLPPSCEVSIIGSSQGGHLSDSITLEDFQAFTSQVPSLFSVHREADQGLADELERNSTRAEKALATAEQGSAAGTSPRARPTVPQEKANDIQVARLKAEVAASTALFHALQVESGWKPQAAESGPGSPRSGSSSPRSSQPGFTHDVLVQKTALALKQQDDFIISLESEVARWRDQAMALESRLAGLEKRAQEAPGGGGSGAAGGAGGHVGVGCSPRPPVELEECSALIYTAVPEERPPPNALEKATLTDSGSNTGAETAEPGGQRVSGAAAVPTIASDEVDVCFARDISETAPGELSERMRRLRTAVKKYTGRTLSSGVVGDGGSSPASPLELLDMAIASLLDASTSAQGSTGSASELVASGAEGFARDSMHDT